MSFWCHHLDQNTNEIFSWISALASKMRWNQKVINISILIHFLSMKVSLFFSFNFFLKGRTETWKNFVYFLVPTMTLKRHFEINWPLDKSENIRKKWRHNYFRRMNGKYNNNFIEDLTPLWHRLNRGTT